MLNKVMIIGRLGGDPELRYTKTGIPVTTLNVATDESYTDREGNRQDKTEWHRVVVFQKQAENCANFLGKGSLVYVEGSLQTRKWQDQQGQDRYVTEIKGQRVQFLDRRGERSEGFSSNAQTMRRQEQKEDNEYQDWKSSSPNDSKGEISEHSKNEDLGPAFPSEASSMDDYVF